jgi:hypothetical protein
VGGGNGLVLLKIFKYHIMRGLVLTLLAAILFISCQSDHNDPVPDNPNTDDSIVIVDISGTYPVTVNYAEDTGTAEEPKYYIAIYDGNLEVAKVSDSVIAVKLTSQFEPTVTDTLKLAENNTDINDTCRYERLEEEVFPGSPLFGTILKFNVKKNKVWLHTDDSFARIVRTATN